MANWPKLAGPGVWARYARRDGRPQDERREDPIMNSYKRFLLCTAAVAGVAALVAVPAPAFAQAASPAPVAIDNDDIGGVVTGANGPEAGVWVIAETTDLPTRFTSSVVTVGQGRYVLPDLPKAKYKVWVRGYGLIDSPRVDGEPGQHLNLTAVTAPNDAAAAEYYPAIYWYSMLKIPAADQFGGTRDIPPRVKQSDWLDLMRNNGCIGCHQIGGIATRTIPMAFGTFKSAEEAWIRRTQSGQAGELMVNILAGQLGGVPYKYFGDWTDRIAKGELPHAKPPRPQGLERNIVVTTWDWSRPNKYLPDIISSDRRNPTVNAGGPVYGSPEYATDEIPILDPKTSKVSYFKAPVRDSGMPESLGPGHAAMLTPLQPSAYWGNEQIWDTRVNNHNSMFDKEGNLWFAAAVRGAENPDFCKKGSDHPSAKVFPLNDNHRELAMLDPKTMKYTFVDTCFQTQHLNFAYDANETLWTSSGGGGGVVGWLNTKMFKETGDAAKSQGWTALVLDTNGNGKRDDYVEPNRPVDPTKDKRVAQVFYAVMVSPADGSIWGTLRGSAIARINPGVNPPATALTELYNVAAPGFGPRGADIDSKGVVWVSLGSGHLGAFDRSKCKVLNGPAATGNHCPEGWSFYQYPGPGFDGIGANSAESSYYTWVDQHNTFGLGEDVPISTGNLNDGLVALKDGKMITMKVPYPTGFFSKGLDGRIDDPNAGWKGRGLWVSSGDRTPWMQEGGIGMTPMAVHFQIRPDPLAH
jgi:hypothetical protein